MKKNNSVIDRIPGPVLVFIGAFLWSLNSPIVKFLSFSPFFMAGMRSIIAALALTPFLKYGLPRFNKWVFIYIISYCGLCISVIYALSVTAAPIAVGMQYTAPVWLFLVAFLSTGRFNKKEFISIFIITIGIIIFMSSSSAEGSLSGNIVALFEGIIFAVMTVSVKKAAVKNVIGLTCIANYFTGIAAFLIKPSIVNEFSDFKGFGGFLLIILGVVQVAGGYVFYNLGVQKTAPSKASIIALWEMILGPLWVAIFLREYPSLRVFTGFIFIILGIVVGYALTFRAES